MNATPIVRVAFASDPFTDTPAWDDVSADGLELHISRGRQHELNRMECGTATLKLANYSGQYYPYNAGGTYYPDVLPGKRVNIRASYGGVTYDLYTGFAESWTPGWLDSAGQKPITRLDCADLLKNLSRFDINSAGYASEASGTRIANILDDLGWPDDVNYRDLATGQTTLIATGALANANAKSHLDTVQQTEGGIFFISGAGKATFHDRHTRLVDYVVSSAIFGDDSPENKYKTLDLPYDDQYIYNAVYITRAGGTQQSATDATSQTAFGLRTLSRTNQLMTTDYEALSQAQFLISRYKNPALRAKTLVIWPDTDPANLWPLVLGLDISDRITVRLNQASIDEDYHIEGITHDYSASTGVWETRWQLSNADNAAYWALGIAGLGELGETTRLCY